MSELNDWNKKGFIEQDGKLVPVKSLVSKGKVEKFETYMGKKVKVITEDRGDIHCTSIIEIPTFDDIVLFESSRKEREEIVEQQFIDYLNYKKSQDCTTINIKPMSVNGAWAGKRFKTPQYKKYTEAVSLLLPNDLVVPEGLLRVYYEFGMSTNSDFDNPVKLITDILQKKYGFNDRNIMDATIKKVIVKKGQEFIKFRIESL
jgi:hypothetical protein